MSAFMRKLQLSVYRGRHNALLINDRHLNLDIDEIASYFPMLLTGECGWLAVYNTLLTAFEARLDKDSTLDPNNETCIELKTVLVQECSDVDTMKGPGQLKQVVVRTLASHLCLQQNRRSVCLTSLPLSAVCQPFASCDIKKHTQCVLAVQRHGRHLALLWRTCTRFGYSHRRSYPENEPQNLFQADCYACRLQSNVGKSR